MKKISKEKVNLIIKISIFIVFWPFVLVYFLYKKYRNWKFEKIKQNVLKEIEIRYEKFPFKDRFTQEEIVKIILQEIEYEAQLKNQETIKYDRDFIQKVALINVVTE